MKKILVLLIFGLFFFNVITTVQAGWEFVDLSTFTEQDARGCITYNSTRVNISSMQLGWDNLYLAKDYGSNFFGTNFKVNVTTNLTSPMTVGGQGVIVAWSNHLGDMFSCKSSIMYIRYYHHEGDGKRFFHVGNWEDDAESYASGNIALSWGTDYYLTVTRIDGTLTCDVYSDIDRLTLVETISKSGLSSKYYRYMYVAQSVDDGAKTQIVTFHSMNFNLSNSIVEAPTSLFANRTGNSTMSITWDMGANSTNTIVEQNTIPRWGLGEGTEIYDGTSDSCLATNLNRGITYYYQAWAYNVTNGWISNQINTSNITGPNNPTNVTGSLTGTTMNVTWTTGTFGADSTIIVSNINSYTTGPTEGTEEYNGTASGCNITNVTTNYYYTLYSFNNTVNRFSTGITFEYGSLTVNAYSANTSEPVPSWSIYISNQDGSETYENTSCTNPLIIDTYNLPKGDDTLIIINNTIYETSLFYMDIANNTHYSLNAFLTEEDTSSQYVLSVVGEEEDYGYEPPIDGVTVYVKKYINASAGWQNTSILVTNANGQVIVNLEPEQVYLISLAKEGYVTAHNPFRPPEIEYSEDRYHTFRLYYDESSYDFTNQTSWWEFITLTGELSGSTLFINYTDSLVSTIDTQFKIYEYDNSTSSLTLVYTINSTNTSDAFTYAGTTGKIYMITVWVNSSLISNTLINSIWVYPSSFPDRGKTTPDLINNLLEANYGTNPLGWSNTIAFFLVCAGLFAFGEQGVGITLVGTGFMFLFINSVIGLVAIGTLIPILFIVFGVFTEWIRHNKRRAG